MSKKDKRVLENLIFYNYNTKKDMKKGLDRCFLHYGIRQEDMEIIEQACKSAEIDADWMKEYILKPYNEERNNENIDDKKLKSILNKALKKL